MSGETESTSMTEGRGLLTDREREALEGDASDSYRYKTRTYLRKRIEKFEVDAELLAEHEPELYDRLADAFEIQASETLSKSKTPGENSTSESKQMDEQDAALEEEQDTTDNERRLREIGIDPPKKTRLQEAVLDAYKILKNEKKTKTSSMKEKLWKTYGTHYSSKDSMWVSISRILKTSPHISMPRGEVQYVETPRKTEYMASSNEGASN